MERFKILLAGGLILIMSLPVLASNGNPRLLSTTAGAGSALVFCGAKPYQDDSATAATVGLYLLTATTNYFIDTTAYSGYTKYGVTSTPLTTTVGYLLLSDTTNNKYATPAFTLGSPVGPADEVVSSITWFNRGKPDAPSSLAASAGFETAKLTWALNPNPATKNFDYSSIEITINKNSDSSVVYETGAVSPTVLGGTAKSYTLGELIDGRKLEPGTKYDVSMVGKVIGKADKSVIYTSDPATISFTTLAAAPQSFTLTLESLSQSNKTGINIISMPFGGPWYYTNTSLGTTEIKTAYDLAIALNNRAGTYAVSTFGKWNKSTQTDAGIPIPAANPDDATVSSKLKAINLAQGEGYQIYLVSVSKVELTIRNTK